MATFNKGILGGFSGKVGNVVGAHWRGLNIMRSVPPRRGPGGTPEQIMQRQKFKTVVQFLQPIRFFLGKYYGDNQGPKSRFNLATAYHLQNAVIYNDLDFEMRYNRVTISKGDLPEVDGAAMTALPNQEVQLTWLDNSSQSQAQSTDEVLLVLYAPNIAMYMVYETIAVRGDEIVVMPLNAMFQGEEVHVWMGFYSQELKKSATSVYAGTVTVL
jgi:hypothetical protein